MKKTTILIFLMIFVMMLCSCGVSTNSGNEIVISDTENSEFGKAPEEIDPEEFASWIAGWWVETNSDYNEILLVEGLKFCPGVYESEFGRSGVFEKVVRNPDGVYEAKIYCEPTPEYGEPNVILPEEWVTMMIKTDDNFKTSFEITYESGWVSTFVYAGDEYEELTDAINRY